MKGRTHKVVIAVQIFFLAVFGIVLYKERDSLSRFCRYPFPFILCPVCDYPCFFKPYQWKVALGVVITGIAGGRVFCGTACPVGTVQDSIWGIKSKITRVSMLKQEHVDLILRGIKYIMLVLAVTFSAVKFALAYDVMPRWLLVPALRINLLISQFAGSGYINFWILFIVFTLFLSIVVHRAWCKYICPMGILFAGFNKISLVKFKFNRSTRDNRINEQKKCGECRSSYAKSKDISTFKCSDFMNVCTTGKPLSKLDEGFASLECTRCFKCITACPKNELYLRVVGKTIKK